MQKLLGGNAVLGVLLGAALLAAGLLTHRPVLAIAGGFVAVASVSRLVTGTRRGDRSQS